MGGARVSGGASGCDGRRGGTGVLRPGAAGDAPGSDSGAALRVSHGPQGPTTKDENGLEMA